MTNNLYFGNVIEIMQKKSYRYVGSREESEVAVFFVISLIRMMGYFRLGLFRKLLSSPRYRLHHDLPYEIGIVDMVNDNA